MRKEIIQNSRILIVDDRHENILVLQRMLEEAAIVAKGGDPKAVIRDPSKNVALALPRVRAGRGAPVAPPGKPRPMLFHAGQPREIAEEMERIWAERSGLR